MFRSVKGLASNKVYVRIARKAAADTTQMLEKAYSSGSPLR